MTVLGGQGRLRRGPGRAPHGVQTWPDLEGPGQWAELRRRDGSLDLSILRSVPAPAPPGACWSPAELLKADGLEATSANNMPPA